MRAGGRVPSSAELRVLMTADTVGGVFSYATTLARALCRDGAEVTLVLQGPAVRAGQRAALANVRGLSVIETDLDLEWLDVDGRDFARARITLERIAADVRPDVVHLNGFREACVDTAAPRVIVAHSCVPSWWAACRGGVLDTTWDAYAGKVRAGLQAADAWAAPSRDYRDAIVRLHAPPTPGHVVYNGIAPVAPGLSTRPVVLAAGRMWDEAKDLATIVHAASLTPWPVEIAGPLSRDGEDFACDAGVAHLLGEMPQAQLAARMGEAAVFASAAVYEPFGLAVLEAAASGCALVLSDIDSFRELWDEAALFFPTRDAPALARCIDRLATDDALRADMQRRARTRAARYTAQRMLEGTRALYASILTPAVMPARFAEASA